MDQACRLSCSGVPKPPPMTTHGRNMAAQETAGQLQGDVQMHSYQGFSNRPVKLPLHLIPVRCWCVPIGHLGLQIRTPKAVDGQGTSAAILLHRVTPEGVADFHSHGDCSRCLAEEPAEAGASSFLPAAPLWSKPRCRSNEERRSFPSKSKNWPTLFSQNCSRR